MDVSQTSCVVIAGKGMGLKSKTSSNLQASVSPQVPEVPQVIWLSFENGHDNGTTVGQDEDGTLEEANDELLIRSNLTIDILGDTADVWKVEDDPLIKTFPQRSASTSMRRTEFGGINVKQDSLIR